MVASARSFSRSAVAAAVILLVSACGGGETPEHAQAQSASPEVVQALSGPAVPAREKILAVSAPVSKSGFSLTADIKLAGTVSAEERAQKQATASAVLPLATKAANVLNWAEVQVGLKQYFPTAQVSQDICIAEGCFTYRLYPETGNIVGIKMDGPDAGGIYLYGPYVGNALTRYAHVDDSTFRCIADVDSCRPKVVSTSPSNGAVDVSAKGTAVNFVFSEAINCAGVNGTGEVGSEVKVIVTITCQQASRTVTVTPKDNRWPFGIEARLAITGVQNLAGYPSLPVEVAFKTKPVQVTPAFFVGDWALPDGSNAVHVMNPKTGAIIKEIDFLGTPGFSPAHHKVVDLLSGYLVVFPVGTRQVYYVDLEDYQVTKQDIDTVGNTEYVLEGAFLRGGDVCTAITRSFVFDAAGHGTLVSNNQLSCWNRTTKVRTVLTAKNSLAEEAMRTFKVKVGPDGKIYLVNGLQSAHDNGTGIWSPGTAGELRVLDPATFALVRKVSVGSVPVDFVVHPTSGDGWVLNGGDKTISVVRSNNQVETFTPAGYTNEAQRPTAIALDVAKGHAYVADSYNTVFTYDVATRKEVWRLVIGSAFTSPQFIGVYNGEIWTSNAGNGASSMSVINPDTFAFRTITGFGYYPGPITPFLQ